MERKEKKSVFRHFVTLMHSPHLSVTVEFLAGLPALRGSRFKSFYRQRNVSIKCHVNCGQRKRGCANRPSTPDTTWRHSYDVIEQKPTLNLPQSACGCCAPGCDALRTIAMYCLCMQSWPQGWLSLAVTFFPFTQVTGIISLRKPPGARILILKNEMRWDPIHRQANKNNDLRCTVFLIARLV